VPAIRLRVASSVIATVSDRPGSRSTSAASVTIEGAMSVHADSTPAANAANAAAISSSTRA
jgi:hypothetical protein